MSKACFLTTTSTSIGNQDSNLSSASPSTTHQPGQPQYLNKFVPAPYSKPTNQSQPRTAHPLQLFLSTLPSSICSISHNNESNATKPRNLMDLTMTSTAMPDIWRSTVASIFIDALLLIACSYRYSIMQQGRGNLQRKASCKLENLR